MLLGSANVAIADPPGWKLGDPLPKLLPGSKYPDLRWTECLATVHRETMTFVYEYTLFNSQKNVGGINYFNIDIRQHPEKSWPFSMKARGTWSEEAKIIKSAEAEPPPVVQVQVIAPGDTRGYVNHLSAAQWSLYAVQLDKSLLPPGKTMSGFKLISLSLPGVREFTVVAADEIEYDPEDWGRKISQENIFELNFADRKIREHAGKTIAPVPRPDLSIPEQFVSTIQRYLDESLKQKWIKSASLKASWDTLLVRIKQDIVEKKNVSAKEGLWKLIQECEKAFKKEEITAEAYALLKYNAEHLLGGLE